MFGSLIAENFTHAEFLDLLGFLMACPNKNLVVDILRFLRRQVLDQGQAQASEIAVSQARHLEMAVCNGDGPMLLYGLLEIPHAPTRIAALHLIHYFSMLDQKVSEAMRFASGVGIVHQH